MNDTPLSHAVKASKAPAIARAAAVMRLLGKADTPLSLQAIARELALVPSTCLYVLRALVEEELVGFDAATKRYTLGPGVLSLAHQWLRRDPFRDLAQPLLDDIARRHDITALGVQIAGLDHIIAVAVSQGTGNFRLSTQVGSRFPALISATGRCIAAFGAAPPERLEGRFSRLRWDNPPDFAQWQAQVATTRRRGWAVDAGQYIAGVTVLAAPVWSASGVSPSHALVASGLSRTIDEVGADVVGALLKQSGDGLSAQLRG